MQQDLAEFADLLQGQLVELHTKITLHFNRLTPALGEAVNLLDQLVKDRIADTETPANDELSSLQNLISSTLTNIQFEAFSKHRSLTDKVNAVLNTIRAGTAAFTLSLNRKVQAPVTNADLQAQQALIAAQHRIVALQATIARMVADAESTLRAKIQQALSDRADEESAGISLMESIIKKALDGTSLGLIMQTGSVIEKVGTFLHPQFEAMQFAFNEIGGTLTEVLGGKLDKLVSTWAGFPEASFADSFDEVKARLDPILKGLEEHGGLPQEIKDAMAPGFMGLLALGGIAASLTLGASLGPFIGTWWAPQIEKLRQDRFLNDPVTLIPIPDLLEMVRRSKIDPADASEMIERQGYSEATAGRFLSTRHPLNQVNELLVMWLRGIVDPDDLPPRMMELGYTKAQVEEYKLLAFPIPPTQDIIRMAVREVFSPEIAEKFGQFEDIPEDYTKFARMSGLSEEWSRRVWAAHWELPSIQQAFEMLHRGEIEPDTLKQLMVALDVMPFWRKHLTAIAFRVFNRVDVRRMRRLGVLDRDGVKKAYEELGYDDIKAEALTEFTERLVAEQNKPDNDKVRELTLSQVMKLFESGLFNEDNATAALLALDFDPNTADTLITLKQVELLQDEQQDQVALIQARFTNGTIDYNEATTQLDALGIPGLQRDKALIKLERSREANIQLPSKADFDRFYREGMIDSSIYQSQLRLIGYPPVWAVRYQRILDADLAETDDTPAKRLDARLQKWRLQIVTEVRGFEARIDAARKDYDARLEEQSIRKDQTTRALDQILSQIDDQAIDAARQDLTEDQAKDIEASLEKLRRDSTKLVDRLEVLNGRITRVTAQRLIFTTRMEAVHDARIAQIEEYIDIELGVAEPSGEV